MELKPKAYNQKARQVEVGEDRDSQRLDNFLNRHLKDLPKSALYRLIRTGQVRVNGGRAKPERKLQAGDVVRIPPVIASDDEKKLISQSVCQQISEAIIHEDDEILVVNKPTGMAVHAGSGLSWGIIDVVRQLRPEKNIELVHRIDRETSGCLLMSSDGKILRYLAEQFRQGSIDKNYLCLLNGILKEAVITVDAPLAPNRKSGEKVMEVSPDGQRAVTQFRVLEQFSRACYAKADIKTGRTHQIRAHARHLDAPIAGDKRYSSAKQVRFWRKLGLKRLFLHASGLSFSMPDGEKMTFNASLPPQLQRCIDLLESG